MKKVVLILSVLAALFVLLLCACRPMQDVLSHGTVNTHGDTSQRNRFISVGDVYYIGDYSFSVYCDSVTQIVYLLNTGVHQGAITVLYGTDGTPMTYEQYRETR